MEFFNNMKITARLAVVIFFVSAGLITITLLTTRLVNEAVKNQIPNQVLPTIITQGKKLKLGMLNYENILNYVSNLYLTKGLLSSYKDEPNEREKQEFEQWKTYLDVTLENLSISPRNNYNDITEIAILSELKRNCTIYRKQFKAQLEDDEEGNEEEKEEEEKEEEEEEEDEEADEEEKNSKRSKSLKYITL